MEGPQGRSGLDEIAESAPFPDLLVYVDHDRFEGERVLRYSLDKNGRLEGADDAAVTLMFALYELSTAAFGRMPLSGRD